MVDDSNIEECDIKVIKEELKKPQGSFLFFS